MPTGLVRYQQTGDLHFVTFSCVRKRPILGSPEARDKFLEILEQTRVKYQFHILAYVVMPNHVHLLVTEPGVSLLGTSIQVIKQRFSRTCIEEDVWEPRYHDFNVKTPEKRKEKLKYIHRNPVKAHLVAEPDEWRWSSFRSYAYEEAGPVTVGRAE
jgi:putative transposase